MTFEPTIEQRFRIEHGMSVDFWFIRKHPDTDELHVARVPLTWDEERGDWKLPSYLTSLIHAAAESNFFSTEDAAREALARGEWKRDATGEDPL